MTSVAKCKICSNQATTVSLLTLQHLLKLEHQSKLNSQYDYYFCSTPKCEVVYFSPSLEAFFSKADVIVPIGIKESVSPKLACYCFNFSTETILEELTAQGSTTVPAQIKLAIKAKGCDCERKNPSGRCCLGEIAQIIKHAQTSLPSHCRTKSLPQFNCCK